MMDAKQERCARATAARRTGAAGLLLALLAPMATALGTTPLRWTAGEAAVTGAFEAEAVRLPDAPGAIRRYGVRYPSGDPAAPAPDDVVPGELYLPAESRGGGPFAAVVILHILNGNYEFERLIAGELARHGVAAFWFKLPHYGERREPGERLFNAHAPDRLLDVFDRGALDVRRAFDLLAALPEIDGTRIGLAGLSMGGMVASFAASLEPRTERLALLISGGGLRTLVEEVNEMRHLRTALAAREPEERERLGQELDRFDPLRAADALRGMAGEGRVLMISADADEVVPPSSARALGAALGMEDRIVWLEGLGHYTVSADLPIVLERMIAFFGGTPGPEPVAPADLPIGAFAETLGLLLLGEPGPDAAQTVRAAFEWTPGRGRKIAGTFSWRMESGGRFLFDADTNDWGRIRIGQAGRPWLLVEQAGVRMDGDDPVRLQGLGLPAEWDILRRVAGQTLRYGCRVPGLVSESLALQESAIESGGTRIEARYRRIPGSLAMEWGNPAPPVPARLEARFDAGVLRLEDLSVSLDAEARPDLCSPPDALAAASVGTRDLATLLLTLFGVSLPEASPP